jgi:hypothetical protein
MRSPDATGLSRWQHFAKQKIESTLLADGIAAPEWQQLGEKEQYLFVEVPDRDIWIYVYLNQANLAAVGGGSVVMFEEWASGTPAELAAFVCEELRDRLQRRAG